MPGDLGPAHGGRLVQLVAEPKGAKASLNRSLEWPSAVLHAQDVLRPDLRLEAERVLGTDPDHPGVRHLREATRPWLVGDVVEGVRLPTVYDFRHLRHTPAELRTVFASVGWRRVVAFQTRNPMHRAHLEPTLRAAALEPLRRHEAELGITMVPFQDMVYAEDLESISGTEQRRHLREGRLLSAEQAADRVLAHLQAEGYLSGAAAGG